MKRCGDLYGAICVPQMVNYGVICVPQMVNYGAICVPQMVNYGVIYVPQMVNYGVIYVPQMSVLQLRGRSCLHIKCRYGETCHPIGSAQNSRRYCSTAAASQSWRTPTLHTLLRCSLAVSKSMAAKSVITGLCKQSAI